MSKTRSILTQVAPLALAAAARWFVTGALPVQAQPRIVAIADAPGVTVNLNGSQIMHRTPVNYPAEALAKGVEGTVVVQVRLDANGEVVDDAILSGPGELRRGVQQSVLNWHFDKSAGSSTRVVNIDFVKPATPPATAIPATVLPPPAETRAQIEGTEPAPGGRGGATGAAAPGFGQTSPAAGQQGELFGQRKLDGIEILGLSDSAREQLRARLPVHAGDTLSLAAMAQVTDLARQFDPILQVSAGGGPSGALVLRIKPPVLAGAVQVPGNVQAAKLIYPVAKPAYPPLSRMARQQGTVRFQATIGKDGRIEDLQVVSGPPPRIQAAMNAVEAWVYSPTLINGLPVEVATTIDVGFSSPDGFPAPAR